MSETSNKPFRSKIPLFQGTQKKNPLTKTVPVETKNVIPNSNATKLDKSDCLSLRNISEVTVADKSKKLENEDGIQFKLDPEALKSILTNKGIGSRVAFRASEMSLRPTVCSLVSRNRVSLMESVCAFEENMKLHTERVRQSDNTFLTPRKHGNHVFSDSTPRQSQLGNTIRICPSFNSRSNNTQKAWTESKENRFSIGRGSQPAAYSTSKINSGRFYVSEKPSSMFQSTRMEKLQYSERAVKRPLLPSLIESEETEQNLNSCCSDEVLKGFYNSSESKGLVEVCSSARNTSMLNTVQRSKEFISTGGLASTFFSNPLLKSADVIKPSGLTSASPLCQSNGVNLECSTWERQKAIYPHLQSGYTFLKDIPVKGALHFNTTSTSNLVSNPDRMKTSRLCNTCQVIVDNIKCSNGCMNKLALLMLPPSADLNNCLNKLTLSPSTIVLESTPISQSTAASQLPQHKTAPSLKEQGYLCSTPARFLADKTSMSNVTGDFVNYQKLPVTPLTHVSGKAQRVLKTPTSASLLSRPPMRVLKSSTCLKNKENSAVDGTHYGPMRNAVSSVKKLKWASTWYQGDDFED